VLRKIFGTKMDEVYMALEETTESVAHDLYRSPYITQMIMSRKMRLVGKWHVWEKKRNTYKYLVGNLKERNHLEDLGVDGRTTLKKDFKQARCKGVGQFYLAQERDKL